MIDWFWKNKEWIFSGIGISIIYGLYRLIKYFIKNDKTLNNKIPLMNIINYSELTPAIRNYLNDNNIIYTKDVYKINFDDMLKQKGIAKHGVSVLIRNLTDHKLIILNKYLKKYL